MNNCRKCGKILSETAKFCGNCGTVVQTFNENDDTSEVISENDYEETEEVVKKKNPSEEAKKDVKWHIENDWVLKEEMDDYYVLERNKSTVVGHLIVGLLTIWWTIGIGNLAYWFLNKKKKIIFK